MDFYATTIVDEYNLKMDPLILYNCTCYNEYLYEDSAPGVRVDGEEVMRLLLKLNKSYAACIQLKAGDEVLIKHKVLPIMIGSKFDAVLRPNVDCRHQLGAFVLNGGIKILPAFITNNLRSGHVYRPNNVYKWYLTEDCNDSGKPSNISHTIQYPPTEVGEVLEPGVFVRLTSTKRVTEKRAGVRGYSIKDEDTERYTTNDTIFELVNRLSPVNQCTDNAHVISPQEYIEFFKCSIDNYPELDDLSNKTIITPTSIFETAIKKWSTLPQNSSKLGTLVSGNLFYTLSSKTVSYIKNDEFKTAYLPIEGHRVSMIDKMMSIVKRHISHGVRNSEALKLPRDSGNFICPLNVKEMKNAGETMALAQFVMIAPRIPLERVIEMLREKDRGASGKLSVIIEGFLTKFRVDAEDLLDIKKRLIIVTMVYEDRYVNIYHAGHLPVKYSTKYEMFVGVYEALHTYPDAFEGLTTFSAYTSFAMTFHRALLHMPPAKATVSINNIKGSCSTLYSRSDLYAFMYSIGFTNSALMMSSNSPDEEFECVSFDDPSKFMIATKTDMAVMTKFAELKDPEPAPAEVLEFFKQYKAKRDENLKHADPAHLTPGSIGAKTFEERGQCYRDLFDAEAERHFERIKFFLNQAKSEEYNVLDKITGNETLKCRKRKSSNDKSNLELKRLRTKDYEKSLNIDMDKYTNDNRILIYTGLSNLNCDTVEDGIVLDETFCKNSPLKLFSVTLSLRVFAYTGESSFSRKSASLKPKGVYTYKKINKKQGDVIVFGMIITDSRIKIQRRRAIVVHQSFIKNTFRYLITMSDPMHTPKTIDSFFQHNNGGKSMLMIHYHYAEHLGVGSKLANLHGQKGIVSSVKDLSKFKHWTADGKMVHPQLLFSKQSLAGRMTSSQTLSMLNSPDLAVNEDGECIAPLAYFVHQIEAKAKCKKMLPKNDLMTAENGFLANGLTATMNLMAKQYPLNENVTTSPFMLELIKLGHVHVNLTPDLTEPQDLSEDGSNVESTSSLKTTSTISSTSGECNTIDDSEDEDEGKEDDDIDDNDEDEDDSDNSLDDSSESGSELEGTDDE